MPQLNTEQLTQRHEVLKTMINVNRTKYPWLSLKEATEKVSDDLTRDPALLRQINALAASTTR
jgi:hypothetical protein